MHLVCPHCFTKNRVPDDRPHSEGHCGKCAKPLGKTGSVDLGDAHFYHYVQNNDLPVLVDFWADWCQPCHMMAPVFERVAAQTDSVLFAKVNTQTATTINRDAGIRSIPTLILFYGGNERARTSGALNELQLKQWIMQSIQAISR